MGDLKSPKLRFPEFDGAWGFEKVGDYINVISGVALKGEEITEFNTGTPIMRGINISEGFIRHNREIDRYYVKPIAQELKKYLLEEGDLVIGMDGSKVGKNVSLIKKEDEKSILIQRVARVRATAKADIKYLFQRIFSKEFQSYVDVVNTSSGIPHISLQQIKDYTISFPSLPEQTKIASFLTAVDKKLQGLKAKKALLERYKKGVMQQLFSRQLRFNDDNGQPFPDWEEKKLGEIGRTYNGLIGKTKEHFGNGKRYIQYKQIFDNAEVKIEDCGFVQVNKSERQNNVKYGDIFFTTSSETSDEVGMSSVLLQQVDEVFLNSFCFGFRANSEYELNPRFSKYAFRSDSFRDLLKKLAQGSTRYNMSKTELMKLSIQLPSLPEQTKIANFLSAIDEKINAVQQQIEKTESWKRGLLQQLFV